MVLDEFFSYTTHKSKFSKNLECSWLMESSKVTLVANKGELFSHVYIKSIDKETFRLKVG